MADKPVLTKKFNKDFDVEKALREGGVQAKIYLGVQGSDVNTAKKALENTVYERLKAEEHAVLLEVKMYDVLKEQGAKLFSGVAEVDLVADDFRWFLNLILRYGPSAVEIIEPGEVTLGSDQMHCLVADASDFAHVYSQQIMAMLKDPERRRIYEEILGGQ